MTADYWKSLVDDKKDRIRELLADAGGAKGVLPDGRRVTIAHRQNADSTVVAWELVAKAYRKYIEQLDQAFGINPGTLGIMHDGRPTLAGDGFEDAEALPADLDAIESMFTTTKPGARPLRITIGKDTK